MVRKHIKKLKYITKQGVHAITAHGVPAAAKITKTGVSVAAENARHFRKEVLEKLATLATAAFGLVAALAWNTAIQELFKRAFANKQDTQLTSMILYAVFVTVIAVLVTIWITRTTEKLKPKKIEIKENNKDIKKK
jgi:uncharacterized BrkB/YihY/UPF0761 family membrane protein